MPIIHQVELWNKVLMPTALKAISKFVDGFAEHGEREFENDLAMMLQAHKSFALEVGVLVCFCHAKIIHAFILLELSDTTLAEFMDADICAYLEARAAPDQAA
ncbi:hypothetical protein OPT61_g1535 [Boeremia exigua]|uniref:Uncharacterized protein n=1 Tax=Boeremia exigua TaxID=749465 RepID=A0ACC2IPQ3_9PLEO|nr:hypothetical protein OPT61_g1535 [Boeremia exigua]